MRGNVRVVTKPSPEQIRASIESRNILALDPGTTTGWASFEKPNNRDGYRSGQIPNGAVGVWMSLEFDEVLRGIPDTIVCESFQYRPKLDKAVLEPVEVIGAAKVWAYIHEVKMVFQTPAMRMWWTDERLKQMDLYKPGHPHANDAMRHLLYLMNVLPPKPEG